MIAFAAFLLLLVAPTVAAVVTITGELRMVGKLRTTRGRGMSLEMSGHRSVTA